MANTIEIVKPITIEVDGTTYTLEFNRDSVISAERAGFVPEELHEKPMSTFPLLFYCAFKMHHPKITRQETDRIYFDVLGGLNSEEIDRLAELYAVPTSTLFRKESDGERKNVKVSL